MSNDIFGGIMKGLGSFMPQDDPNVKLFQSQTEISELQNKEQELYAKIGSMLLPEVKDREEYRDIVEELSYIQKRLKAAQEEMKAAQNIKSEQDQREQENLQSRTCANCDTVNPEGVKFCQECGARLNQLSRMKCPGCGAEFPAGTRFCGECGTKV